VFLLIINLLQHQSILRPHSNSSQTNDQKASDPITFDVFFTNTFDEQHTMSSDESQQRGWGECNLETCPVEWSIFQYQPSLPANAIFIAIFGISMLAHIYQGYRWRQWTFATLVAVGCAVEMIGHGGRIIMHDDPWSFSGFMLQISEYDRL
jgi:hypothetical protein